MHQSTVGVADLGQTNRGQKANRTVIDTGSFRSACVVQGLGAYLRHCEIYSAVRLRI
jgi:hypothetical protein